MVSERRRNPVLNDIFYLLQKIITLLKGDVTERVVSPVHLWCYLRPEQQRINWSGHHFTDWSISILLTCLLAFSSQTSAAPEPEYLTVRNGLPQGFVKSLIQDQTDEGDEVIDSDALRQYQHDRLKYYYAVVDCDSVETAKVICEACDGMGVHNG